MKEIMNLIGILSLPIVLALTAQGCSKKAPEGMLTVESGEFTMGSNMVDTEAKAVQYGARKPWYMNEHPERKVSLKKFFIDSTEVTNSAYKAFVDKTGHEPPLHWATGKYPDGAERHPVVFVSWFDAKAFCEWAGKRLPTEAEWEKTARGTDGRAFPWGNDFDIKKLNTLGDHGGTLPVGSFEAGKSPYGALDMSGNAAEWTADSYAAYPGSDYSDDDYGDKFKVVRGGGWGGVGHYASHVYVRASYRNMAPPGGKYDDVGFRCAWQ